MHGIKNRVAGVVWLCLLTHMAWAQARSDCSVRLGPAVVDFGRTTRGQLLAQSPPGDPLSFGLRRAQANVQCEQPGPLRLTLVAPAANAGQYRFGAGTLSVRVLTVRVDGKAVDWISDGQAPAADARTLQPGASLIPAVAGMGVEGRSLEVELELEAHVTSAATRVSDLTRFETRLSFRQ
jgi:hypothetical protein